VDVEVVAVIEQLAEALETRDMYHGGKLCGDIQSVIKEALRGHDTSGHSRRVRGALERFGIVITVDAKDALTSEGTLEFDVLLSLMGKAILAAKGIELDAGTLHPEDMTQLLKDEKRRILVCLFSVLYLSEAHLQRLRGLGLTQTKHRVLFCGFNEYLHEASVKDFTLPKDPKRPEPAHSPMELDTKRTVLLVEDHPPEREAIRRVLVGQDFHVETAADYHVAVSYLSKWVPHLVCLDLTLPRESAFELCEYIRNDVRHKFVPVLVMSDRSSKEDMAHAEYVGANAFLKKPFSRDKLLKYVFTLLDNGRGINIGSSPPQVRRLPRSK
jgi:CheY-like chemotaxis protein